MNPILPDVLPDVQAAEAPHRFKLTRVGVTGIRKPVRIERPEGTQHLIPTIDVYVDLPAEQKGSHLSRNVEVLDEIIDATVREPARSLEALCATIGTRLLERHDYATVAEVEMEADYFLDRKNPSGRDSLETYALEAQARIRRDGGSRKAIGVKVTGMTACPCAMEAVRSITADAHEDLADRVASLPLATHNQRNVTTVVVETGDGVGAGTAVEAVEANDLIHIAENALSTPTYELLKRGDEADIVLAAHRNPKFVEDVVRGVLDQLVAKYDHLPDDTRVLVRSRSEESIHKHDAVAERLTTMGELRA